MNYGIQMYSIRDLAEKDLEGALRLVSELGYKYVEYAGFFGHSAEEIAAWQQKYGLICSGTHTGGEGLLPQNLEETVRFHKTIGNTNYIIPGADLSTLEKIDGIVQLFETARPYLEENGIRLAYHNHYKEFKVMPWGSTMHSELELRTGIDFEIDTYWAFYAGVDPLAIMERLKNRIRVIHLKDGIPPEAGSPLGEGKAPVRDVRKKAAELGFLQVVESETLRPNGPDEARRCIEFLKKLDAEDGR